MGHAQPLLDVDGGRRKGVVRGRGGDQDEVDVGGRQAGAIECRPGCLLAKRGGGLALARDVALADARALDDPFVRRRDHALQLAVGDDALGQCSPVTAYH